MKAAEQQQRSGPSASRRGSDNLFLFPGNRRRLQIYLFIFFFQISSSSCRNNIEKKGAALRRGHLINSPRSACSFFPFIISRGRKAFTAELNKCENRPRVRRVDGESRVCGAGGSRVLSTGRPTDLTLRERHNLVFRIGTGFISRPARRGSG